MEISIALLPHSDTHNSTPTYVEFKLDSDMGLVVMTVDDGRDLHFDVDDFVKMVDILSSNR